MTEGFLSHVCEKVDAVEQVGKFTDVIHESQLKKDGVVGDIYTMGIEDWYPEKKYDLIWTQWCVGHLTGAHLVDYIVRCREALNETGILVLKENLSTDSDGEDMYDDEDSSVTRTDEKFRKIFARINPWKYTKGTCYINKTCRSGIIYIPFNAPMNRMVRSSISKNAVIYPSHHSVSVSSQATAFNAPSHNDLICFHLFNIIDTLVFRRSSCPAAMFASRLSIDISHSFR